MKNVALLVLLAATTVFAQQPAAQPSDASQPATAQPAGPQPKFDMADVRVSPTARGFAQNFGGVLREGKYINRDATMLDLIAAAYGAPKDTIAGGPGWLGSDLFNVVAKVPDGTTQAKANLMLQALLADRFHLVVRNETHPVPRFILTVGKGGSKLKTAASPSDPSDCKPLGQPTAPPDMKDLAAFPNIKVACHNMTAAAIAENLHQMAGGYLTHDVIDKTGLEGSFDFNIEWSPSGPILAAKGPDGISIFNAVDKQLGLKLEQQDVPMPSLVIASIDRKPTANPAGVEATLALAAARFEAATIKPADPNTPARMGLLYRGGSQMWAGGTLSQLISMSLQLSPNTAADVVVGLPKSAETQRWDINAKVPSTGEGAPNIVNGRPLPPPLSVGLEMLRGLLVDQFEMKTHTENREVTVYALVAGSGKPKMTPAGESERAGCAPDANAPKPATNITGMFTCKATTMPELAHDLEQMANAYMDHPVVDLTGITGEWDFTIGWTAKALLNQPAAGAAADASDPGGLSVFEAVERELGLKLVKQKASIPVIVIDHIDEKPIE